MKMLNKNKCAVISNVLRKHGQIWPQILLIIVFYQAKVKIYPYIRRKKPCKLHFEASLHVRGSKALVVLSRLSILIFVAID